MNKNTTHKFPILLFFGYVLTALALFLYSYTQVDLGLTLTEISLWQTVQRVFQEIGYFERTLSTTLYIAILFAMFVLWGKTLSLVKKGKISAGQVFILIAMVSILLVFSYPAFSYDMFNYMFTAKTVLLYHKNPYEVTPLQFTGYEPWLSFMHWTHKPSAYAPMWILLSLPPYLLGFGYFLLILWNFKLLIAAFYLLTCWAITKILADEDVRVRLEGLVLFALNPLVLIECLVSAHNDIVMSACALVSLVFLQLDRRFLSFALYAISSAVKQVSLVLLPVFFLKDKRRMPFLLMSLACALFLIFFKRELLPWYGIWIFPFASLYPRNTWLVPLTFGVSVGLLLTYAPFLYYGHWNDPVGIMKIWAVAIPVLLSLFFVLFRKGKNYRI